MTNRRAVLCGLAALGVAGRAKAAAPVVVSSKLDVEGGLIGAMILLALKDAGIPTTDRLLLGPTAIVRQALLGGAVDIYPEYTGNAAFFFHQEADPVWKNAKAGYARAAALDRAAHDLVWLAPAPADNSWAIAVPRAQKIRTLADFAHAVTSGAPVRLAASAEFVESPAGLPAFEAAYHFHLTAAQLLVLSGGETSATMKAASDGISGVTAAMAYASDGALDALDLVALEDTLHAEPVYAPAPVVRAATLAATPQIVTILAPVFAGLDLTTLRALNEKVAVEGQAAPAVARAYLSGLRA